MRWNVRSSALSSSQRINRLQPVNGTDEDRKSCSADPNNRALADPASHWQDPRLPRRRALLMRMRASRRHAGNGSLGFVNRVAVKLRCGRRGTSEPEADSKNAPDAFHDCLI
jgi:hypothetical protein